MAKSKVNHYENRRKRNRAIIIAIVAVLVITQLVGICISL